jgi:hypothetical protein
VVSDECFFNTSQYVYFAEDFNNDVIVLKDNKIEKILSINFGEHSISKNFLKIYKGNEFIKKALSNKKATNISTIVETENLFAFQYVFENMLFQIIYNKHTKKYLNGISLNNGFFPSEILTCYNNYFVSALSAEYLEVILPLKYENNDEWNKIISSAHPIIKDILLNSKEGITDDYIIIYEINM